MTINQPIGGTVSNEPIFGGNPVCPNCLPYEKCGKHNDKLNGALTTLGNELVNILQNHCGEHGQNEGAVETLERIIRERDLLLKRANEEMLKPAHY